MRRHIVIVSVVAAFVLGACGIKGDLKTAPPLWGDKDKAEQTETPDTK